ncbi:MAG: PfkB family carbohydrate kinase [Candidatus Levyibacteriota bacterium]
MCVRLTLSAQHMIIVTGTIAYDYIMDFPGKFGDHVLPDQVHNINLSFIVSNFAKRRGGTAGNVSYALGLLFTPHILFSIAGKDFGEYKKHFQEMGISVDDVVIDKNEYTATGFAMTDKLDNQIWGYYYGATDNIDKMKIASVAKKEDIVVVGPSSAKGSMAFVRQCIDLGVSYLFDPGFILTQVSAEDLRLGILHAAYVVGNDYELNVIKDRVKDFDTIIADKVIVTTLGKKGAEISDKGKKMTIAPAKPAKVIDPTGAGDAWRAGFLAGLSRGFTIDACGQMGSVASSFAVEVYGTQEYVFSKKDFLERYRQTYKSLLEL